MDKQKALEDVVSSIDEAIASLKEKNPEFYFNKQLFMPVLINGIAHALIKYSNVGGLSCDTLMSYVEDLWSRTFDKDFH